MEAMTAAGVQGTNTPDVPTGTTADFGFALLMATARRVTESEHFTRALGTGGATTCCGLKCTARDLGIIGMGAHRAGHCAARGARLRHGRWCLPQPLAARPRAGGRLQGALRRHDELLRTADHVVLVLPTRPIAPHHRRGRSWRR